MRREPYSAKEIELLIAFGEGVSLNGEVKTTELDERERVVADALDPVFDMIAKHLRDKIREFDTYKNSSDEVIDQAALDAYKDYDEIVYMVKSWASLLNKNIGTGDIDLLAKGILAFHFKVEKPLDEVVES